MSVRRFAASFASVLALAATGATSEPARFEAGPQLQGATLTSELVK